VIVELAQALLLLLLAPLITGLIRTLKARMQSRRGPGVLQPYRDLAKLFSKSSVVSRDASWVSALAPYVCLTAVVIAALLVPVIYANTFGSFGDLLLLVYLLAAVRFFTALAALDAGSTFGGMGSSREMFISSIVEPTMLLSIFAMALVTGTTDLGGISRQVASTSLDVVEPSLFLAAAAFFIATLAENARVPVDNPATHLELTMVHEVMVLDHSGPALGLILYGAAMKLLLFSALVVRLVLPATGHPALDLLAFGFGLGLVAVAIGVVESTTARVRLVQVPRLLVSAGLLCGFALLLVSR
jgi:formate hydrogenlyase subunit 4